MLKKLLGLSDDSPSATMEAPVFPTAEEVFSLDQQVDELAKAMTPEKGILWAGKSAEMVEGVISPEDAKAAEAAVAFAQQPQVALQKKASEAAKAVEQPGPGAMAAQAAGLSLRPAVSLEAAESMDPKALNALEQQGEGVVSSLVAGAVKLAAALKADPSKVAAAVPEILNKDLSVPVPETPEIPELDPKVVMPVDKALQELSGSQLAETAQALQPFLELGKNIQSGAIA